MVSLSKLVTLVFIIFSYRIVEFENGNHTQTSDSYSAYCYPSKSTHSISILEDNRHICIYHWIYHTKTPFLNRRHVIPPTKKNFHLLIQILLSNQVETNPGPRTPRWPCGSCGKAVTLKSRALECDSCKTWYHVDCQGQMSDTMYSIMDNSNISWNCLKCGLPNFSSTFFNQSIPSSLSANFFSVLSCNSPGEPFATSSPKSIHSHSSLYHHNSTTHHGYHTNRKCKTVNRPLRIISLNFQSIKNKKTELDLLLDTTKPDVIIGTETWLDSSISSSEYFPASRYNVYRRDRPPNSKGQSHGGVLIAINSEFDSTEVNSLQTDCEIVWVELTIQNSRKLLLSSFYRPQPNDDVSLEKLNQSLKRLNPNSKSIIIVSGDFNLGHIDWTSSSIIPGKPNVKQHQEILDIIADHSLTQIVDKPTRNDKTLDLIITNYPSIVDNFETIPPIGEADHDILICL